MSVSGVLTAEVATASDVGVRPGAVAGAVGPSTPPLPADAEGLVADVDAVLGVLGLADPGVVAGLSDDDLVAALVQVEAVGRLVDAVRVALAGEAADRSRRELGPQSLAARFGCRTAHELVQRATGAARPTVARRIRIGAATRQGATLSGEPVPARFPALAEALADGAVGVDAAAALVDTLGPCERVAGRLAVQTAEAEIVAALTGAPAPDADADARCLDPDAEEPEPADRDARRRVAAGAPLWDADDVRVQATVWRAVLDPDGTAPTAVDHERRGLVLGRPRHGLVPITGMLLPDVAAGLRRYADAFTNPRTNSAPAPSANATGAPTTSSGRGLDELGRLADRRSRAQVLHDVLANAIVVAARAAETPSLAGAVPTLVVTVDARTLATGTGVAWVDDTPVDLPVAFQTACAGAVERVLTGAGGRILSLQTVDRCFSGPQRRAIAARDGATCLIPGCHVPASWCEAHHVTPHVADPQGTHTDNGVLLCWHHHRTLHQSGWDVRMVGGRPQVRAPAWLDRSGTWRTPNAPPPPPPT